VLNRCTTGPSLERNHQLQHLLLYAMSCTMLGMPRALQNPPTVPKKQDQSRSSSLRQGPLLSTYLQAIMCDRACLRGLYLQVSAELRSSLLRTWLLDAMYAMCRAMSVVMSSSCVSSPLWISESSTLISVLCFVANLWADMHLTPLRFTLPERPQVRSSLCVSLWRTMRRSALHRMCILGRKRGCCGFGDESYDSRPRPVLQRT